MFFSTGSSGSTSFFLGMSTHYFDRLHDFSVTSTRCYENVFVNRFFTRAARL